MRLELKEVSDHKGPQEHVRCVVRSLFLTPREVKRGLNRGSLCEKWMELYAYVLYTLLYALYIYIKVYFKKNEEIGLEFSRFPSCSVVPNLNGMWVNH